MKILILFSFLLVISGQSAVTPPVPAEQDASVPEAQRGSEVVVGEESVAANVMVRGTVVDADGAAVPNAEVLVFPGRPWRQGADYLVQNGRKAELIARSSTGPDGSFEVMIGQGSFYVTARTQGMLAYEAFGTRSGAQIGAREVIEGMVVRLGPIARAKGRVLDPDGQPVKGQLVHFGRKTDWHTDYEGVAIKGPSRFDVTTDEQGRFELTAPAGLDYTVDVPSRFFPMYRESHTVTEGAEILLQLDAGEVAAGTVFLEDGRPAVGAVVRFYSFPQRHATTDASGRFEIMETRRVDKSYITVGHKNAAVFCLQPIPEDASDLVLQLEQGQVIEGRIVDGDGQGIEGALIQVVGERVIDPPASHGVKHTWEWANETSMTRSDRDGRFRFSNLYSGSFQLKAALEQLHIGAVTTTAKTGRSDVEIELSTATTRRAALRLLVLGRQAGEPIPHAGVKISPDGGGSFRNLVTDDSGHAIAVGFEPGGYNVKVDHPGFAVGQEPLKLRLGDNEARIELSPPVDVELRIRTKDGQLIHQKNRVVGIKRANGELFIFWVGNEGHAYKRILGGVVKLRGVPSEMVTLVVKLERGGIVEQPLDLRVESGSVIDVVLDPPSPLALMIIAVGAIVLVISGWLIMKAKEIEK